MITSILEQIFKGALLIFLGTLVGKGLEFCSRLLIGRVLGPSEFGIFNMGYTVVSIGSSLSLLGLSQGVAHFIPSYGVNNSEINRENISLLIIFLYRRIGAFGGKRIFITLIKHQSTIHVL